ncbi:MAG: T9SS type A sorting domain-containing protein [Bacteroidia bacterium]
MKKSRLLYLCLLCVLSIIFSSYYTGVATTFGLDCTGAETAYGNTSGCSITGACHAHTPSQIWINVNLELDSAGMPVTHYVGGMEYSLKLTGTNVSSDSLPYFGFQVSSIAGDTSAAFPVNAGTWTPPFPAATHYSPPQPTYFNLGLMEQNPPHPVTTGTGTMGSTYEVAINWTAPVAGTGDVSFWGVVNAINNNGHEDGDNYNNNHMIVREWPLPLGINESINSTDFLVYPNPVVDQLNLSFKLEKRSAVSIMIYDLNGKQVLFIQNTMMEEGIQNVNKNIADLKKGIYLLVFNVERKSITKIFSKQ